MTFWTDAKSTECAGLWQNGLSAAQVARAISAPSRNAVISKLHRMGLTGRPVPEKLPGQKLMAPVNGGNPRPVGPPMILVDGPSEGQYLADLPRLACRYPLGGTGHLTKFCGQKCAGTYCADHVRICYVPVTDKKKASVVRGALWAAR